MEAIQRKKSISILWAILPVLLLLFCEWFFFRQMYGTSQMFGDLGDGRLTMLISEHWYHFFRGEASFADLGIFFPASNTLAYSDMFLCVGIIHSILRLIGLDIYMAFKYSMLLIHAIGTLCSFYYFRRVLRISGMWALFGTIAFSFSESYLFSLNHPQMMALSLLPLFAIFITRFFQYIERPMKRRVYACLSIVSIILVLYTAWYVTFFSALFSVTTLLIWSLITALNGGGLRSKINYFIHTVRFEILIYFVIAIILAVPFIALEWPQMKASGGFGYWHIAWSYMPEPIDIIHVTTGNYLMGKLISKLELDSRSGLYEVAYGFSIVLLVAFLTMLVRLLYRKRYDIIASKCKNSHIICEAIAFAVLVDLLFVVRLSSNGVSLWYVIYKLFPGGKSIRAIGRFLLFLNLPLAFITSYMATIDHKDCQRKKTASILRTMILSCSIVLLLLSNMTTAGFSSAWNADDGKAVVQDITPPPEDCEIFFIYHSTNPLPAPYRQVDAYQIADKVGKKTLNGYSGQTPREWEGLWEIDSKEYLSAVSSWIKQNNLQGVYGYDQMNNQWIAFEEIMK